MACCQERRQGSGGEGRKRRGGRGDGKRIKTCQRAFRDVWDNIKKANIQIVEGPEEEDKENEMENI